MITIIITSLAAFPSLVWNAQGRADAERDIVHFSMKWKIHGHMAGMAPADEKVKAKLRVRFGIELEVVGFCTVTPEVVERAKGYNDRIREEVDGKHGTGAVERVWREVYRDSYRNQAFNDWLATFMIGLCVVAVLWTQKARERSSVL